MASAINDLINLAKRLNASGEIGDGMVAQFHSLADRAIGEMNNRSDNDIAIGEHAFTAGWNAHATRSFEMINGVKCVREVPQFVDAAWSEYTPPDDLCGN